MPRLRSYTELCQLDTFEERFSYLALKGQVGAETFGFERRMNQRFYHSHQWRRIRRVVLLRDNNCDLGIDGLDIPSGLHIHHMNPVTVQDLLGENPDILDPEFLISTTQLTHNAIHYGDERQLPRPFVERQPGDHISWKKGRIDLDALRATDDALRLGQAPGR